MTTALGCILPWCSSKASTLACNAQGLALSGWAVGGEDRDCSGPHCMSALGLALGHPWGHGHKLGFLRGEVVEA